MSAAAVFLYVILHDDDSVGERFRTPMPDMQTCIEASKSAQVTRPDSVSGDYEALAVVWCGGDDFQRNYNATWWRDPVKEAD